MKKKYGLFKVLVALLLLIVVASYFINGRDGAVSYLALGDVFVNYMQSFYYFFETALFVLIVGGFYGVLNRIPAYNKLVKMIVDKVSGNSKLFVIIMTIVFLLMSSLTGLNTILLLFIPFVVSIILLLGYDKLVALSATVGGSLVGFIGGIFVTFKDASSQYEVSYSTFDKLVGLDGNWSLLIPKILLLLIGGILLIFYIVNHIKKVDNKEVSYSISKVDSLFVEAKDRTGKKIVVDNSNVKVWPMIVVFCIFTILLILGYLPWNDLFGIGVFTDFHTWLTGFTFNDGRFVLLLLAVLLFIYLLVRIVKRVKNDGISLNLCGSVVGAAAILWIISIFGVYSLEIASKSSYAKWIAKLPFWKSSIYTTILSNNFNALGNFGGLGTFMAVIIMLVVSMVVLKFIYKLNFDDAMDGFIYGVKKMVPAAMIAMLAYAVLVCSYNNGFIETIITSASKSFGDNVVVNALISMLGSVLNVDTYYTTAGVFSSIVSNLSDKANLKIYAIMFQSLYGLVQLAGPSSLMLIVGLSYLEVPYKTWLRYVWRLVVGLFIVILVTLMIVSLL